MYLSVLYGVKMNYDGAIAPRGAHEVYSLKKIDLKKITSFSLRAKLLFSFALKLHLSFKPLTLSCPHKCQSPSTVVHS